MTNDPKNNEPPRLGDDEGSSPRFAANESLKSDDASADKAGSSEELAKLKSDFLYLAAEFDNYKKQMIKERSDLRKFGSERLIVDLLSVLDIFDTALGSAQASGVAAQNIDSFVKGIELTAAEFRATLGRHGVTEVASMGQAFDPNVHEALSSEETSDLPQGHVLRVFKKPYRLHDRVIRPGQVVVAKPKG